MHPGRQKKAPDRGDDAGHISAVLMVIVIIGVEPLLLSRVWIVLLKPVDKQHRTGPDRVRLVKWFTTTSGVQFVYIYKIVRSWPPRKAIFWGQPVDKMWE